MKLEKETIDKIFDESADGVEAIIALYKTAIPQWDDIESLDGWPTVNRVTAGYISEKFLSKWRKDGLSARLLWMNMGFSTLEAERLQVNDWEVDLSTARINYAII